MAHLGTLITLFLFFSDAFCSFFFRAFGEESSLSFLLPFLSTFDLCNVFFPSARFFDFKVVKSSASELSRITNSYLSDRLCFLPLVPVLCGELSAHVLSLARDLSCFVTTSFFLSVVECKGLLGWLVFEEKDPPKYCLIS